MTISYRLRNIDFECNRLNLLKLIWGFTQLITFSLVITLFVAASQPYFAASLRFFFVWVAAVYIANSLYTSTIFFSHIINNMLIGYGALLGSTAMLMNFSLVICVIASSAIADVATIPAIAAFAGIMVGCTVALFVGFIINKHELIGECGTMESPKVPFPGKELGVALPAEQA